MTPADFLGNLNSFLDDEDSADAEILKKMVVMACINVEVPELLNKSLVEIRDLLSRFIVYREDEPKASVTTRATEEVKQAQREAKEDAERIVAEEDRPDTNEMSEGRSADRSYIPSDIGTDTGEDEMGVCPDKPEEDADAIHLLQVKGNLRRRVQRGIIPLRLHWHHTFQDVEGVCQQRSRLSQGSRQRCGIYCPYIAINGRDDWTFTEVDKENIPVPPTYDEVVAAPRFKNVRFQSANHRDEETFYWSLKLKGLHLLYRIWTAGNVIGVKAEQFRGINQQKDTAFVSDTVFRCIALGPNCDYMTFYRTDVSIGRKFLKTNLAAIICVQSAKEVDISGSIIALHREDQSDRGDATISARKVPMEGG